ncbi:MAG TPA: hypothetical protein VLZ78_05345 [Terrimesophilobacter sp.]|nr:hypothetical protein [Terrimesophilobacter sp.]
MPDIAVKPIVLKDCLLTLGTDNYQAHVSQVRFTPSAQTQTWQGLTPAATFTDTSVATWTLGLSYAQDWETPDSLARYLYEHEGEIVPAIFEPKNGGASWGADIVITPGAIGGTVNQFATADVTLGVSGRPELLPAA